MKISKEWSSKFKWEKEHSQRKWLMISLSIAIHQHSLTFMSPSQIFLTNLKNLNNLMKTNQTCLTMTNILSSMVQRCSSMLTLSLIADQSDKKKVLVNLKMSEFIRSKLNSFMKTSSQMIIKQLSFQRKLKRKAIIKFEWKNKCVKASKKLILFTKVFNNFFDKIIIILKSFSAHLSLQYANYHKF